MMTQQGAGKKRMKGRASALAIAVLACIAIPACAGKRNVENGAENAKKLREALYGRDFRNEDVRSIDIVRIEHPMLGGVLGEITLSGERQQAFLADMERVERKGIYKCRAGYVVRVNFVSDTLRLKICDGMIANRQKDLYYVLPDGTDPVKKYWE